MKTTHTHKGHCQVCGAMHAVDNSHNGLAKHGYDVSWGFFNGVCSGADNLPIQLDRTLADKTIARSEEHTSELQSRLHLVCRLPLENKKKIKNKQNKNIHTRAEYFLTIL